MQDYGSCCLTWFNSDDDAGLYGEPLSCADQDASYDDSYYLTYEEVHHPTIQDYTPKQIPYSDYGGCGSWLRDYFAGCDWAGGNEAYSDQTLQSDQLCECDFSYYDDDIHPNYNENNWIGCGGLEDDLDDVEWDNWDKWEGTTLYDTIFGY